MYLCLAARRAVQEPTRAGRGHASLWPMRSINFGPASQSLSTVLLEVRGEDGGQLGGLGLAGAPRRDCATGLRVMETPAASSALTQFRHNVLGSTSLVDVDLLEVLPGVLVKVNVLGERHGATVAQLNPGGGTQPAALPHAGRRSRLVIVPCIDGTLR